MKKLIAGGFLQKSRDSKIGINWDYIRVMEEATKVIMEKKTPVVVTRVGTSAKWYRGRSDLNKQYAH